MVLLRVTATVDFLADDGVQSVREELPAVEFVVRSAKKTVTWPPPLLTTSESLLLFGKNVKKEKEEEEEIKSSGDDDCESEGMTEVERALGPPLSFYAPLGCGMSREIRAALHRGVVRLLTRQVLQQLSVAEKQQHACTDNNNNNNNNNNSVSLASCVLVEKGGGLRTPLAHVHWSEELLRHLLPPPVPTQQRNENSPRDFFIARLPSAATLIPLARDFKATSMPRHVVSAAADAHKPKRKKNDTKKTCKFLFTVDRMEAVQQSLHDERTADRLASRLYRSHLCPAEKLRESGGESLQPPFANLLDALDCYRRALASAQRGLLYPYRHALRPPPSMEDRAGHPADDDDVCDDMSPVVGCMQSAGGGGGRRDFTPANRYLNRLLCLRRSTTAQSEVDVPDGNSALLAGGRALFPDAHALLHVWYGLHRQVVVAVANAAQTLLLMQSSSSSSVSVTDESSAKRYGGRNIRQHQMQVVRWCTRALNLLQQMLGWWDIVPPHEEKKEEEEETTIKKKEWLWLNTMRFKLLLRQAKLLRAAESLDESQRVQAATEEQLRIFSMQTHIFSSEELGNVLNDVKKQLMQEKSLLRDDMNQKCGLMLRL